MAKRKLGICGQLFDGFMKWIWIGIAILAIALSQYEWMWLD